VSPVPLIEQDTWEEGRGMRKMVGRSWERQREAMEVGKVFRPSSDRVNGGGALDLEAVRARRKNPRTDSAIGAMRW
jgi:hypothetical protein